jgi:hypothetical protein
MDTHFHGEHIDIKKSRAHALLVALDFPIIYTTNYDRWIEKAYEAYGKPYDKITNIFDFTQTHQDRPQVVKYHGDFDDDQSIVLTETSYFKRLSLDTPLDIKLRTDTLGRSLLYRLQLLWGSSLEERMRPKSYILLNQPNRVQERILAHREIDALFSDEADPGQGLIRFLEALGGN